MATRVFFYFSFLIAGQSISNEKKVAHAGVSKMIRHSLVFADWMCSAISSSRDGEIECQQHHHHHQDD